MHFSHLSFTNFIRPSLVVAEALAHSLSCVLPTLLFLLTSMTVGNGNNLRLSHSGALEALGITDSNSSMADCNTEEEKRVFYRYKHFLPSLPYQRPLLLTPISPLVSARNLLTPNTSVPPPRKLYGI